MSTFPTSARMTMRRTGSAIVVRWSAVRWNTSDRPKAAADSTSRPRAAQMTILTVDTGTDGRAAHRAPRYGCPPFVAVRLKDPLIGRPAPGAAPDDRRGRYVARCMHAPVAVDELEIQLLRGGARAPERARPGDAGYDLRCLDA